MITDGIIGDLPGLFRILFGEIESVSNWGISCFSSENSSELTLTFKVSF